MTAYDNFIKEVTLEKGKFTRLWELKVNGHIENLIKFSRDFLKTQGFTYTGYTKDSYKAIYNDSYVFEGLIQDGNKIAIRIIKL